MKTVGKQLEEARLARNWTPEMAARETKIKVDRLRDLEADDYTHFTNPTYARGFVRTYARALNLDEYRVLRQLDNRLPDDDSANIVTDGGVAYLPETALPPRVAHRDYTGLYIVVALGALVTLAILFVLFEAYRVGELARYFKSNQDTATTSSASSTNSDTVSRALPVDSDTPPPIAPPLVAVPPVAVAPPVTDAPQTNGVANIPVAPRVPPRALPVNPGDLGSAPDVNAVTPHLPPRALPVNPSAVDNSATTPPAPLNPPTDPIPVPIKAPPRALPVTAADLAAAANDATPTANTVVAANTDTSVVPVPVNPRPVTTSATARQSNSGSIIVPPAPPVAPVVDPIPVAQPESVSAPKAVPLAPAPLASTGDTEKRLMLTASQDSFVRVINLDTPEADRTLYAAILRSGHSISFGGRKFSINVGIPSAVNIQLDGVNYGPHSDRDVPETFTVTSHMP